MSEKNKYALVPPGYSSISSYITTEVPEISEPEDRFRRVRKQSSGNVPSTKEHKKKNSSSKMKMIIQEEESDKIKYEDLTLVEKQINVN